MVMSNDQLKQPTTISQSRMFKTANEFSLYIEDVVKNKKQPYMDAVLDYCKENYLEPKDIVSLINKSLKDKIGNEFREQNYLPKQAQLDV